MFGRKRKKWNVSDEPAHTVPLRFAFDEDRVREIVRDEIRRAARPVARTLPGRAGRCE